ncbi:RNA-directed DNA polymerase, eukaryota [Tanacetum coccineum]
MENGVLFEPTRVKEEAFCNHFASSFHQPSSGCSRINFTFPNRLSQEKIKDLEDYVSTDEIRKAVWECGENKSPGPDGYTFEFYRKFWYLVGSDFCKAIQWFFYHSNFLRGCNSSFVALIPKVPDAKLVSDFRPISLLGSMYKVITKILANRLSSVISDLVSDVQRSFVIVENPLRPFIINELLSWCKRKKNQAMLFKVDFAKAYDSVRWDFLDDVLRSFGFGSKWRSWISGCLSSAIASVIVNRSPTSEVVEAGMYKGIVIDNSVMISRLFYADDAVFVEDTLCKLKSRLSKWKAKTLSIGGRLTLLKAVLGSTPIYAMSLYRVPKTFLNMMESLRSKFFNGSDGGDKKITWIKWTKVLAAKKKGGLGVANGSPWVSILREVQSLKARGIDLVSHCKKRVGDGLSTCFWEETWMGNRPLKLMFPRIYALESNKLCTVAEKCHPNTLDQTFRRNIRGGVESHQYMQLQDLIGAVSLSNSTDRWVWDLNGNGDFMVMCLRGRCFAYVFLLRSCIPCVKTDMSLVELRLAAGVLVFRMVIMAEVIQDDTSPKDEGTHPRLKARRVGRSVERAEKGLPSSLKRADEGFADCTSRSQLRSSLKVTNTVRVNQIVTIFLIESSIHITGTSLIHVESHHRFFPVDTSLIHIESRKSPTKSLFDVGSRRISIFTVNTKEYHYDVLAIITRIMRRTL